MDAARFERVASRCRWSERSLDVARALLVDGKGLAAVAAKHEMKPQQANVLRTRFLELARKEQLESFMAREKPKAITILEPFGEQMRALRERGYEDGQIVAFLRENGIKTTAKSVKQFLENPRA